ncbi:prenyltransferase/squalene oxidase repeat-containing protein [Gracilibacillus alcaliphilus]|uniref:hypothetical protein n=1 Tax=Gracilibacillus alcaliphilus TaxID=1401441 RepID=UPI0019574BA8|nr:hypothetical protein [Gracilibacillus alcaliphilus]MBM7679612.1 hypothetical protein [Gracilibacillus alcaliphilus]
MNDLEQLTNRNDQMASEMLDWQVTDKTSRYFGGITEENTGVPNPSHEGTCSVIATWVSSYLNKASHLYQNDQLRERIGYALDYMLSRQHEDGTISPTWTNYHSPPDTAFIVTGYAQLYRLLSDHQEWELGEKVLQFLKRAKPAMLTGGCHTPNHRWVLTAALAHLYAIFQEERLKQRAEEWLDEGMDITYDGEWTERSNGIYNAVSNISLYYTAVLLDKPELLQFVRRNLDMMVYLIHPDGSIVTDYSGRQDLGRKYNLAPYHLIYRLMAVNDQNAVYFSMANLALKDVSRMGPVNNHLMLGYLFHPEIKEVPLKPAPLPANYEVVINEHSSIENDLIQLEESQSQPEFKHSSRHTSFGAPTVRYREGEMSATVMAKNPSFFSLQSGAVSLVGVELYTNFLPGVIEFDHIEKKGKGWYQLSASMEKGYNSPIPKQSLPDTNNGESVWYLLPHAYRSLTHNQQVQITVDIKYKQAGGWSIEIETDQQEDILTQVVFLFSQDGSLQGEQVEQITDHQWFWKEGTLLYEHKEEQLVLEAGQHDHWVTEFRAARHEMLQQVKVNLVSPYCKRFTIKFTE